MFSVMAITGMIFSPIGEKLLLRELLIFSATFKLIQEESAVAQAASYGIDAQSFVLIGVIQLISVIVFIIPRTGLLGTLLLAAYLGGALVTRLLHDEALTSPVLLQALLWITAAVRFPELRQRLFAPKKTRFHNPRNDFEGGPKRFP